MGDCCRRVEHQAGAALIRVKQKNAHPLHEVSLDLVALEQLVKQGGTTHHHSTQQFLSDRALVEHHGELAVWNGWFEHGRFQQRCHLNHPRDKTTIALRVLL